MFKCGMEKVSADQLPEAGSLPDGFVESSTESLASLTLVPEQEKHLRDYKEESYSLLESATETGNQSIEDVNNEPSITRLENQRVRTFPVALSDKGDASDSTASVEPLSEDYLQLTEGKPVSELSSSLVNIECRESKEQKQCQNSGRAAEEAPCAAGESGSVTESVDNSATKKEISEVKRKSTKRTFKTEKEFLEFTLRFQQVCAERDAANTVRDKLESLCRELQRQNKMLMDECRRVSAEGQNLRLDISSKFEDAIKDVSIKLEEQKDECLAQLKENEMLRNKLKEFADQYTLCEQQFAQKLKQKSLELQIADLKIQQSEEKLVQEHSQMKLYAEQISQLLATEKNLRLQLTSDGEKFQQFQEALVKSNEVFESFKLEIKKMAKSIKDLEKENTFLKSKCEKTDVTLIELVEERERLKKQLEKTKNQKEKLEALCRSLQAERKNNSVGSNSSDSVPA